MSSGAAELPPVGVQSRKHRNEGEEGRGGGGGGGQPLHGAKVDFDMWKAKAEDSNQRYVLLSVSPCLGSN